MEQAWQQVLTPAAESLNARWRTAVVDGWNNAFSGRYPFKNVSSDASLPLLAKYQTRGFPDDIPDEQENDLGSRDIPSWRRICKTLIKNDFWCRTLSFSPNKPRHYERYLQRMKERRNEWGIL